MSNDAVRQHRSAVNDPDSKGHYWTRAGQIQCEQFVDPRRRRAHDPNLVFVIALDSHITGHS